MKKNDKIRIYYFSFTGKGSLLMVFECYKAYSIQDFQTKK